MFRRHVHICISESDTSGLNEDGCCDDIIKGCDGVCGSGLVYDCAEECGGDAAEDNCGTCDSNPDNDCSDAPELFSFNISTQSAFYFIKYVTIDNVLVDSNDWVGAFNGDVCVGAKRWDTNICQNGVCDIPLYGDDGTELTAGYMTSGDIPTFKIYDYSENIIYDVNSYSEEVAPWIFLNSAILNSIGVVDDLSLIHI